MALKKINKSQPPNTLTQYAQQNPQTQTHWEDFRHHNGSTAYREIKQIMLVDQGGLCGYCEKKLSQLPENKQRVEHYHSKSDLSNIHINWALDWDNVFAVCLGGSDANKQAHPLPKNLSCDAHKDHLITKGKLPNECEGHYLNPLQLIAIPGLFDFDKATGRLSPNENACTQWQVPENQYDTTYKLVEKTIEILNLNCQRLLDDRLEVLKEYNQEIAKARKAQDKEGLKKLSQRWFSRKWPSFFTTRRILLGQHAEACLENLAYNG